MANTRITLILEGQERDDGHVALNVFLSELKKFQLALNRVDEKIGKGTRNSHFAIVALSHSSPSTIEIEPRVTRGKQDLRALIGPKFAQQFEDAQEGRVGEDTDYDLLSCFRGMASPVGDTLKAARIKIDGTPYELTRQLAGQITASLEQHESCFGTVQGMLERINVHADANEFTIFPDVGPTRITCHFNAEDLDSAVSAVKRRVAVTGEMRFRKVGPFPYHIEDAHLEIYDPEDRLPSFEDLRGMAPDATGELSAADFVAKFRDGWT